MYATDTVLKVALQSAILLRKHLNFVLYLSNCNSIRLPTGCLIDFTVERSLGGANIKVVDGPTLAQAHRCFLVNTPEIQPYIEYVTENYRNKLYRID